MRKKLAQSAACGLIGAILVGGLVALYVITGRKQAVWPFPATARLLPSLAEIVLWMAAGGATLFALWVLFAVLFKAAGWYDPNSETRTCPRCNGSGRVPR